ncbi:hypothetical protein AHiyo4_42640 [Arthrobacter sp. Hiyo4]|nr:hypothetical protein AHiyo4_42640 [Arthrobacter sp. Hiyo4]
MAGVIFAKATSDTEMGFAITMNDLFPVASQAASLSAPVSSGQCIQK